MKSTGVIIARLQTPYLHPGHFSLIQHVKEKHNKVVMVLGVSPVKSGIRNPLDFYAREKMVKKAFPDIVVLPLSDCRNDAAWSECLDNLLSVAFPSEHFVLYGGRDSFIPWYSGKNEVREIPPAGDFSGAMVRDQICDKVLDSEDFRCGIIYANYNRYPTVYPAVDIALFDEAYTRLLLGNRISEGKWRLPGGFTDPADDHFEAAALRELQEECGPVEVGEMRYERSFKVDDWRYRQERDKIITLMFSCLKVFGEPVAGDDLDEVKWFTLDEIRSMIGNGDVAQEHFPQLRFLLEKYTRVHVPVH